MHSLMEAYQVDIVDAVIAFPWFSVTHTRFRSLLNSYRCRFVSMPMLTKQVMEGPLRANWGEVAATTRKVYELICASSEMLLTCPAGTRLSVEVGARETIYQDNGLLTEPGAFGNLPAGEAYFVPKNGSASGRIVLTSGA